MRVLIADDQAEVRSALRVLLENENNLDCFEEAEDLDSLMIRLKKADIDLLLLDWELSNRVMAHMMPKLRLANPSIRIIAMSGHPEAAKEACEAGADAFVSKGEYPENLLEAIHSVTRQQTYPPYSG